MVKLYEYHGYNSLFYKLHVAIDNPVDGHGARADAVARYLDHVREESGEREMQEHWRRIWTATWRSRSSAAATGSTSSPTR